MINEAKAARITAGASGVEVGSVLPGLGNYSEADLYKLRAEIDGLLPSLNDLNLEDEVTELYMRAKALYQRTVEDEGTPANQTAQTLNACSAALQNLVKMRIDLKRDEQLRRMETAMLESLTLLPDDAKQLYFEEYERLAERIGATAFG